MLFVFIGVFGVPEGKYIYKEIDYSFGIEGDFRMDTGIYGKSVINTLKPDYRSMQSLVSFSSVRETPSEMNDCFRCSPSLCWLLFTLTSSTDEADV